MVSLWFGGATDNVAYKIARERDNKILIQLLCLSNIQRNDFQMSIFQLGTSKVECREWS